MAVDMGLFEVAAPPGTGTEWVLKECERVGFQPRSVTSIFDPFSLDATTKPRVSLVRHPCHWLSSIYDVVRRGTPMANSRFVDFIVLLDGDGFDSFVQNYLKHMPGEIGRVFNDYKCNTRMKLEDMPWALIELFESLGVSEGLLKSIVNPEESFTTKDRRWAPQLFQDVIEAESELCMDFDYY